MESLWDFIRDKNGTVVMQAAQNRMQFVNSWLLMRSPMTPVIILATYLMFVLKLGPNYMQNRMPYHFPNIMTLYNVAQVIMSAYLIYLNGCMLVYNGLLPKSCSLESEFNRQGIATAMYYYLVAKIFELLDTIFFVLRKKNKQLSFLHIYHHTLMIIVTWCALKYEPTIHLMFLICANAFVHVIMYTYYGLSAFPSLTKYLWWKRYITSLQLVQFVVVFFIFMLANVYSDCKPSGILVATFSSNALFFLYLFGKFYIRTYLNKSPKAAKAIENKNMNNGKGTQNGNIILNNGIPNVKIGHGNGIRHDVNECEIYNSYVNGTKSLKRE